MTRKIEEILYYSDGKSSTELEEAVSVQKRVREDWKVAVRGSKVPMSC